VLQPGAWARGSIHWSGSDGEEHGSIGFELDLREEGLEYIRLLFDVTNDGVPSECWINLTSVRYRWGGRRWYFRAPFTARRVSKLYLHPVREASAGFRDRRDLGLAYQSQRLSPQGCIALRRERLKAKLAKRGINPNTDWPRKPKGMHWATFHRLRDERREA
jgi:hypothetical protein